MQKKLKQKTIAWVDLNFVQYWLSFKLQSVYGLTDCLMTSFQLPLEYDTLIQRYMQVVG